VSNDDANDSQLDERDQLLNRIKQLEQMNWNLTEENKMLKSIIADLQRKASTSQPLLPVPSTSQQADADRHLPSTSQQTDEDCHDLLTPVPATVDEDDEVVGANLGNNEEPLQISRFEHMDDDMCSDYLSRQILKYRGLEKGLSKGEVVGAGSYGVVYKATYKEQSVVVKQLSSELLLKDQCLEVELATKLCHENLIGAQFFYITFDALNENQCQINMVMPFMDKCDLRKVIEERKRQISEDQCNKICFEVSKALVYLHSKKIVHRDLKPENILISSKNKIKVGDYGLCADASVKIRTIHRLGTLPYMAPEVCDKGQDHDLKVDIWALAVIFCELLSKLDNAPYCFSDDLSSSEQRKIIIRFNYPRGRLSFPKDVPPKQQYTLSDQAHNIVKDCLLKNSLKRLEASALCQRFSELPHELLFQ
jgi:tRNA A-37 threonylcarbamoyl transferase component Bud32